MGNYINILMHNIGIFCSLLLHLIWECTDDCLLANFNLSTKIEELHIAVRYLKIIMQSQSNKNKLCSNENNRGSYKLISWSHLNHFEIWPFIGRICTLIRKNMER